LVHSFKFPVYDPAKNSFKKPKSAELKINSLHGWWPSGVYFYITKHNLDFIA
jgi:hypothetical protein